MSSTVPLNRSPAAINSQDSRCLIRNVLRHSGNSEAAKMDHADQNEIDRPPEEADLQSRERNVFHPQANTRDQSRNEQPHDDEVGQDIGES